MGSSVSKCILILSEKSSGSSLVQDILVRHAGAQHVRASLHNEYETLYWLKAASILGLPLIKMIDSNVSLNQLDARAGLTRLLQMNLPAFTLPVLEKAMVFEGWRYLCQQYAPVFVEKSPHHLCQWSALELIAHCIESTPEVDFLLLGLVRSPLDTLYSQFRRWRSRPEEVQFQWLTAYHNLIRIKEILGEKVIILRYEDLVASSYVLQPVFDFCGAPNAQVPAGEIHAESLGAWQHDRLYGFSPDPRIIELAARFGYDLTTLPSRSTRFWPAYRELSRLFYRLLVRIRWTVKVK